jgi:hypothetical protein
MTVPKAEQLSEDYAGNTWLIGRHTEGISHEESMLQPPFPANCMNWILGHIISRRNSALEVLGQPPLWDAETARIYHSGSPALTDPEGARDFLQLLEDLQAAQARIAGALKIISEASLARVVETDRGAKPVWEHLADFHWHETYHLGQLDILRTMILANRSDRHEPN